MTTDRSARQNNVVQFPSRGRLAFRCARRAGGAARCRDVILAKAAFGFGIVLRLLWGLVKAIVVAVLVLFEPVLRCTLVPLAFLSFLVTLVFGVLMHAPRYPVWGMLLFSVGLLWAYWLYLALLSMFMIHVHEGWSWLRLIWSSWSALRGNVVLRAAPWRLPNACSSMARRQRRLPWSTAS
jgi:hypothetical protein